MSPRHVAPWAALAGAAFLFACASAPAVQPAAGAPASPGAPAAPSASVAPSASASAAPPPEATASEAPAAPPPPEAPPPPCIDGTIMMGACICESGKGVDATGHCVFMPCPQGNSGGAVFRDPKTGKCLECRPGTRPSGDGQCTH